MKIAEAVSVAQRCKNHFKAFEKLEEMLVLVAQAEQSVVERTREKEGLDLEIAVLHRKADGLKERVPELEKAVERASTDFGEKTTKMQSDFDNAGQLAKKQHTNLLSKFNELASVAKEEYNAKIKKLEDEAKDVQGRVNGLKKSLAGLLDQVKKVEL
jgi:chaperonin cofactor prefoldin